METAQLSSVHIPDVLDPSASDFTVEAGYASNLSTDALAFAESLDRAGLTESVAPLQGVNVVDDSATVVKAVMAPLEHINKEAAELEKFALDAINSDDELTPSEIVMLTARSQQFMFHAQLTANVANRTADGLQQLFRQQS